MAYHPGENPVIGVLLLLTLLYFLLKVNDINITDFFSAGRFREIYYEYPVIVIVTISVIVYAAYIIYRTIALYNSEHFGTSEDGLGKMANVLIATSPLSTSHVATQEFSHHVMSFDRFYQTFVMVKTVQQIPNTVESELSFTESESYSSFSSESTHNENITFTVPNNRVMVLRTDINGIKYYLVMYSLLESDIPYRKTNLYQDKQYADKAALCKIGGTTDIYVCPVLLREDLLDQEYRTFVDSAYAEVAKAVQIQNVLNNINKSKVHQNITNKTTPVKSESFTPSVSVAESQPQLLQKQSDMSIKTPTKTEAQQILKIDILPRYIHHFTMIRQAPSLESLVLSDVIKSRPKSTSESASELELRPETGTINNKSEKDCYTMSAYLKDQLSDITKLNTQSPYVFNLSKNFSPFTTLRQEAILKSGKNKNNSSEMIVTSETMVDIVNDRKFVCATQSIDVLKYSDFFAATITTPIDDTNVSVVTSSTMSSTTSSNSKSSTESEPTSKQVIKIKPRIDDSYIYTGKNNSRIIMLDPKVNLYVLGDFKTSNQVAVNNVKCWLARLDTYVDPTINTGSELLSNDPYNDKTSPYYMKPRIYNIGIIPDDYKQCTTLPDGTIDSFCRGDKYINGVDYSDARKIDFEMATVQLNSI